MKSRLALLFSLLLAGSMWFYVDYVLVPYQRADAASHGRPRGNLSDLYPRWLGARELLLQHRDPYSLEVTREIQEGYYGRVLDPNRPDDPKDEERFAYPVYVVFLLAPTIRLPFAVVQSGFRWLLAILTVGSVLLWLRVLRWQPSTVVIAILTVLTMGCFPIVQGIKLQQLSLLVAGLIAIGAALLSAGQLFAAGAVLALATIKPQLGLPLLAWLLLWACGQWRSRWPLLAGFGLTMAALLVASEYVLPGWARRFHQAVIAYQRYTGGAGSLLDVLATPVAGKFLAGAGVIVIAVIAWRFRCASAGSAEFSMMFALVLALTVVIVPMTAPYNQGLLLPAVFLLLAAWNDGWRRTRIARTISFVAAATVFWPWLASFTFTVASIFLPADLLRKAWAVPLYSSLGIPLAVLCLVILCALDLMRKANSATPSSGALMSLIR
jgi:Glycosyltransferase family 87